MFMRLSREKAGSEVGRAVRVMVGCFRLLTVSMTSFTPLLFATDIARDIVEGGGGEARRSEFAGACGGFVLTTAAKESTPITT